MAEAGEADVFLGLGSNVGDRMAHLRYAIQRLAAAGRVTGVSSVYESAPVGYLDQGAFLNAVVRLATRLSAKDLLVHVRGIEEERGRERSFRNAPRTLDIDLLLYDEHRIRTSELEVPHPRMHDRPFVLVPLLELDPQLRDPGSGVRYADRLDALTGTDGETMAGAVVRTATAAQLLEEEEEG